MPLAEVPQEYRIVACIGEPFSFDERSYEDIEALDADELHYSREPEEHEKRGEKNAGRGSYVISAISERNKQSGGFKNCTGLVLVGTDISSGHTVSMMSHQHAEQILLRKADEFDRDLVASLQAFVAQTQEGTRDAVIVGGNYFSASAGYKNRSLATFGTNYVDSIKKIARPVREIMHVEPHVVIGPSMASGKQHAADVALDTEHRRLYILRPPQPHKAFGENDISFPASEVDQHVPVWDEVSKDIF